MGNDYYEWPKPGEERMVGIGKNCVIQNCILDKNVGTHKYIGVSEIVRLVKPDLDRPPARDFA